MVYFAKWKITLIVLISLLGVIYATPNFLSEKTLQDIPDWLPNKQVSLGLDLQGGSHLLVEVDTDAVIKEYFEATVDQMRATLRKAKIRYTGLGVSGLSARVQIRDKASVETAQQLIGEIDLSMEVTANGNRLVVALNDNELKLRRTSAVQKSIEIIRRRVDETGTKEPTIQQQGEERILVQLPGIDDPERIKKLIGQTAKMSFHLVNEKDMENPDKTPPGSVWLASAEDNQAGRRYLIYKRAMVSGETLVDAQPGFDQQTNEPIVSFRFNATGAKKFGRATTENVNNLFAIVLDDKVISAPVIREPILGGTGQISGSFTIQGAQNLALLLRAGALPAPLVFLEERSVGPGLGADSIAAGKLASWIGMVAVIVFMGVSYGLFGVMADVALTINIFLILAALSVLQATLTLPGIAGIVLTIGMAVDANVLIFERIREEVRAGRTPISAVDAGYGRALTTIVDANVTTLIAAVLLYIFGSGPIRGFAVTLAIGIVTSMFTAVMLTRLIVVMWLRKRKPDTLPV